MSATAKLFKNGQSQAVRLPKEFRFDGEEVFIKKVGDGVLLLPKKDKSVWDHMYKALEDMPEDFMLERNQLPMEEREELF
ncbi:MAG: type II toxin-antitoxin system VapB family antitoxin [Campylobacterales bacterium]|nr:type II toxin-antitoxin system VapB family antitoxin [Campylobacterales bacterium]